MSKAIAPFRFKKSSRPFKDYYNGWFKTLKNTLLPQLRHAIVGEAMGPVGYIFAVIHSQFITNSLVIFPDLSNSNPILLVSRVEVIHRHFLKYYKALDLATSNDVSQVLYPDYKNPFEKTFLWLGDLHPYLFINLLRSFIGSESECEIDPKTLEKQRNWDVVMAWRSPSKRLTTRVDQIECGLRLMVPALSAREWGRCEGRKEEMKSAVMESAEADMEELVGVFVDASRLRESVFSDILSVTDVNQAAVFLDGLAQFLVGFRNRELLSQFEKCSLEELELN
ncbi:unnamed protein product [Withania somnifera]